MRRVCSWLGVCVFARPAPNRAQPASYPDYLHEILAHAGVCYETIAHDALGERLDQLRILVTIGDPELSDDLRERLRAWVKSGGAWLSIAGVCGMRDVLGVEYAPSSYSNWGAGAVLHGEGYLMPTDSQHPAVAHVARPLHFFGGLALRSAGARVVATSLDSHQRGAGPDVLFEHHFGAGITMALSIDVTGTIARIQQGVAITRDGVSAPDGSAPVADGVLKSGDGGVLDWIFDRQPVDGVPGLDIFSEPIADLWREAVLRCIFHLARERAASLPVLWLYPRALPAIAHMSHDSDGNEPARAEELLNLLKQAEIRSTWCIILPGYHPPIMSAIRQAGHEFATHYDAMTGTDGFTWGETQFDLQHRQLSQLFDEMPVTNKNHYLRWEGDVEFFDWCAARGIELDQSKGPSKTGEAGFNFGSCHPYFPVAFDGRRIDVLELPTLTQDLAIFAPPQILDALICGVRRVHGVLHLLFHPAHVGKPNVNESILHSIRAAKAAGMEWWTSAQLNRWERARRAVHWSSFDVSDVSTGVTLRGAAELTDATILWLGAGPITINGQRLPQSSVKAWGFDFSAAVCTLRAGEEHAIRFDPRAGVTARNPAKAT